MNSVKVFHIARRMAPNIKKYSPQIVVKFCNQPADSNVKSSCDKKNNGPPALPKLPVPTLKETLDTYFQSVKPFLNNEECEATQKILADFECKDGKKLQGMLEEKAKNTNNWLTDWWLDTAYLSYRDPVMIFSSPGQIFPPQKFCTEEGRLKYAAKVIVAAVDFKIKIDKGQLPQEKLGKDLLDMSQYKKVFGTCRQPHDKKDKLVFHPDSKHIVVASNNNYYSLRVVSDCGQQFSENQIFEQLHEIRSATCKKAGPAIGILTAQNRDAWAASYKKLKANEENQKAIDAIESSLFLMCLDDAVSNKTNLSTETLGAHQIIHGAGTKGNTNNRWFDKTLQFIVSRDGINGITYEHSPSEGQPIATLADYVTHFIEKDLAKDIPCVKNGDNHAVPLKFTPCGEIEKESEKASEAINQLICDLFIDVNVFKDFGKTFIKQQKMSPDSFVQMAIQLAFYRIHKTPGSHYESASLRKFIDGRTDTIRSCSMESLHFAQIMLDENADKTKKEIALRKAVESHKEYVGKAVNGKGCDRHLLGLKLLAIENNLPIHDLYYDVAFKRSTAFRLSTSQVASLCHSFMCFAPTEANGYGCCYNIRDNDIILAPTAFRNDETCVKKFSDSLTESLHAMRQVLEDGSCKSKL